MNFKELLLAAKSGQQEAISRMVKLYDPLLRGYSWHDGAFDEDLYQELRIILLRCIRLFPIHPCGGPSAK